jgi:hypothetical protein
MAVTARLAELEAALAASFDRAQLAVYGDYLQSLGDPRGELIAIDLHVAEHGPDERSTARKNLLVGEWLGADASWVRVEDGFLALGLSSMTFDYLVPRFVVQHADHVRWIRIARETIREALAALNELAFPWLQRLALEELRDDAQLDLLDRVLAKLPTNAEIVVERAYAGYLPTRILPPRVKLPPPRAWPPPDAIHGRHALTIAIPGDPYGEDVDLGGAARLMDAKLDELPEPARAAWLELWATLDDLPWDDDEATEVRFPIAALARALAPLDLDDHPRWRDLRIALGDRASGDVTIRRYWGW